MNTLLRKELRLLMPAWIVALAAATIPLWPWPDGVGLAAPCAALAVLFLALAPFGQEINWGTFGLLLAQPEKRERVWNLKAGLLAAALGTAWAVFALCWWLGTQHRDKFFFQEYGAVSHTVVRSAIWALAVFSGGLWATLLLRDVAAALFTTLLVPVFIYGTVDVCLGGVTEWADGLGELAVGIYAVAGVFAARRLFLRAQDLAWTGGQISLAEGHAKPFRWLAFGFKEKRGPWSALLLKELQLQEITMILVPLLLVLHLAALAARHFAPEWAKRVQYLDGVSFLWLIVPLVVGSVAVAEERRHNTWEGFLCLPVSGRGKFAVKFIVVMVLGTLLGGVLPSLLERWAHAAPALGRPDLPFVNEVLIILAVGVTAASFFASTMCRGMLQCFTVAGLLTILLTAFLAMVAADLPYVEEATTWGGWLFPVVVGTTGISTYLVLAWRNCRRMQVGLRLWAGSFAWLAVLLTSSLLATGAIFDRVWEFVIPIEPKHGHARLVGPVQPKIAVSSDNCILLALLPDGRLWWGHGNFVGQGHQRHLAWDKIAGQFVEGNDWVDVAANTGEDYAALAIKSDGTLWKFAATPEAIQVGTDSNWKKIAGSQNWFLGLKEDGTVWVLSEYVEWIMHHDLPARQKVVKSAGPKPVDSAQLGMDSDWVDIHILGAQIMGDFYNDNKAMLTKRDGTFWAWMPPVSTPADTQRLTTNEVLPLPAFGPNTTASNWSSVVAGDNIRLGVQSDGTLWAGHNDLFRPFRAANGRGRVNNVGKAVTNPSAVAAAPGSGSNSPSHFIDVARFASPVVRIGTRADWVSVAGGNGGGEGGFVATEAGGTVWTISGGRQWVFRGNGADRWNGPSLYYNVPGPGFPAIGMKQPSKYHDWLAATEDNSGSWALAADGTLCCWYNLFSEYPDGRQDGNWIKTRPSRRPLVSVNIFDVK